MSRLSMNLCVSGITVGSNTKPHKLNQHNHAVPFEPQN